MARRMDEIPLALDVAICAAWAALSAGLLWLGHRLWVA